MRPLNLISPSLLPLPPAVLPHALQVLLLPMLAPRSYTAEDVVELHTHGGGLCAQRVLQVCAFF